MNTLELRLQRDLMTAMRSNDKTRLAALRAVKAAIQTEKTKGANHDLSENAIISIINKQIKQRDESAEAYTTAGRAELAEKELAEKEVLKEYVPQLMSDEKLGEIIDHFIESLNVKTIRDMGKVMRELNIRFSNQFDGSVAAEMIKAKITELNEGGE